MTDDTTPFTSQRITTGSTPMRVNSSLPTRTVQHEPDRMMLGMHDDVQPTVWDAVDYPHEEEFTFESFWLRYQRQAEARAIIDKPVDDSWQSEPDVRDRQSEDQDEPQTQFEHATVELMDGDHTRRKPIHRLKTADKLARLGRYSFMVLGFGDGADMAEPISGPAADTEEAALSGTDDLHYVATYGEDRIVDWEIDTDMNSPRFMLPEWIEVITQDVDDEELDTPDHGDDEFETQVVHWTRFIHIPEGELEDDLRGTPALKPVFNALLNLDKVKAAAGEGYWRAGYQGLVVRPPEVMGSDGRTKRGRFADDGDAVKDEIREFLQNFERTIATTGDIESIGSDVADPTAFKDMYHESIEIALDIPRSVFIGADRADTADEQAAASWHTTVAKRRHNHNEPNVLEPFIQRLIDVGVLPEPSGDGFTVEWPPLAELTEQEEAEVLNTTAQAMHYVSPANDPTHHWTTEELREEFGFHPERGMDVDEEFQPDEEELAADGPVVDEAALEQFQTQAESPAPSELQEQAAGDAAGEDDE